ncbi:hypothetical protein FPQ18DRAFT_348076 [Pyronema domesticum]|uniref:Similar to Ribonuclease 3 acc. no. O51648 n=1 Tax=Pyronema omphalodes (strain CBS 100304) TaxID=1076935 RepID=U4L4U2_PYROM|nr:hypothetical protein FPQ18DRAFT_348076 [Pyronema domesticum]CCX10885.1 Similar to Ribonuclease 3; acc. no. O51648 [Pyronema omphalodes CBS 100304]
MSFILPTGPPPQAPVPVIVPATSSKLWYTVAPLSAIPLQVSRYPMSSLMEGIVFSVPQQNPLLTWSGHGLAMMLCSQQIAAMFPGLSTVAATDLRTALTSKHVHSHLSNALGLPVPSDGNEKVCADLFEAYLAGISQDITLANFQDLYNWYYALLAPIVTTYFSIYSQQGAPRQALATYTSRLMEYAAKNKLESPQFRYESNGKQGGDILWACEVILGENTVARGVATSKAEAKHQASMQALNVLPKTRDDPRTQEQRRARKQLYRERAKMSKSVGPEAAPTAPQPKSEQP